MEAKTEEISGWILEFLIRSPNLETLAKKCISVLPIPADNLRLEKVVLLRTIECELTDGVLTEETLEALERVEELDSRRGLDAGDAMKTAYAAVAVDLTVRFLVGSGGKPGLKYLNALKRFWRVKGRALEERSGERRSELLSGEFRRWWDELEAAMWDNEVCRRLMGLNSRNDAVAAGRTYLKEAWFLMGKPLIKYGVRLMNVEEEEKEEGSDRVPSEEKSTPEEGMSVPDLIGLTKKVNFEALNCGDDEDVVILPDPRVTNRDKETQPSDSNLGDQQNRSPDKGMMKVYLESRNCSDEDVVILPDSPAANRGKGSQENSAPRPITTVDNLGKPSCSQQNDFLRPVATDADLGNPSGSQVNGGYQPVNGAANLWKPSSANQNDVPRPSLMERNSTARVEEWDDSPDKTPEAMVKGKSKLHLPSPRKRPVSPLKKYEPAKPMKRRKVKRWSLLEEETLRLGVTKFGKGNWKLILTSYRDVFEERTEVDLKDKWRNLMR